jgi:tetratricopeptide (TPR) repeat protein
MRAYVYTDKSLERYAGRFVWLSVNTENKANAAFLKKYPIPALPTLLVLDAKRDTVALRYIGGANIAQVRSMLDDAEKTYRNRALSAADRFLARADDLSSQGRHSAAAKSLQEAMAAAPKNWPKLGRAAESLIFALMMEGAGAACTDEALKLYPKVKGTVSAANVASVGLACAHMSKRADAVATLRKATREVFDDPKIVLSDDDRSGMYMTLIESAENESAALALRQEWAAFLEGAASRAKLHEQRTVYDSHRLTAYLELNTPEKAIPMLEQSQRDFPDDYNPYARLALAYKAMKEYDKALAASDRALALVEGPRRLSVLTVRADIYLGNRSGRRVRESASGRAAQRRTHRVAGKTAGVDEVAEALDCGRASCRSFCVSQRERRPRPPQSRA